MDTLRLYGAARTESAPLKRYPLCVPPLPQIRRCSPLACLALLAGLSACVPPRAELVVANGPDVEVLDPQITSTTAGGRIFSALFEGLTRLDPATLDVTPGLAESWSKEDPSGRVWTFTLRENLRWSDGSSLTVEDVRASWRRLALPATGADYAAWMKDAEVFINLEQRSVQVHFPSPQPLFDRMCAFHALAPIPAALRNAAPGSTPKVLPCSGPYQLIERRIRDRIRVAANPHYWRDVELGFESIDFLTLDSQFTALNLFLSGDVWFTPNVPDIAVPALLREYANAFQPQAQFATYFLRFQILDGPFQDKDLRLALIHSIDRHVVAKNLGGGRPAAQSLVPPFAQGYPEVEGPNFDLDLARAALARYQKSHPGPLPYLEYLYPSSDFNRKLAEVLQQQWSVNLGVEVALANQEAKTFFPAQRGLEYQVSHSSWVGDYLDPLTFLENFVAESGNNRTGYANPEYAKLLEWAADCGDPILRFDLLAQAESLLLEEAVIVPLLLDVGQELVSPQLGGFQRNASGVIDWAALYPESQAR